MRSVEIVLGSGKCFGNNRLEMRWRKLIPLIIILAGLGAYHNSLRGAFVLDDLRGLERIQHIRHFWSLPEVVAGTSRPLVQFSLAMNYAFGGPNVSGYHAVNVAIHILAALTLFGVARRTLLLCGRDTPWLALAVVLIWEVHPLLTQSVDYIIQRGELLMGLFCLLTLYCLIRGAESSASGRWYVLSVACCGLGMVSKPVMVSAPVLVLMYDRTFLAQSVREAIHLRRWLYLGLAATWLSLPAMLAQGPKDWKGSAGVGVDTVFPLEYAATQAGVLMHYLRLVVWPQPLCFDYAWPIATTVREIVPFAIIIAGLLGLTAWALVRRSWLGFLGACFFIILVPTSSFIPISDVAVEHRMYLATAAVVAAIVMTANSFLRRFIPRTEWRRFVSAILLVVGVVGLMALTMRRNMDYRTVESIWRDTIAKRPENPRAHYALGQALASAGDMEAASAEFWQAIRLRPDYSEAHFDLGNVLIRQGRCAEAIRRYSMAIRIKPSYAEAYGNLGVALCSQGRTNEAIECFFQALRIEPDLSNARRNLHMALRGSETLQH